MPGHKQVATAKQRERDEAIARYVSAHLGEKGVQGDTLNEYTRADAALIVEKIEAREWTATAVLKAYIQRAIVVQGELNAITEVLFNDALEQAKALDEEFDTTGRIRGPLHGVPFSAKDIYNIEGKDSTIGYTRFANRPAADTSEIIQLVREAGGIVFAKTNVPQTLLSFECSNPLWGRTLHPLKTPVEGLPKNSKIPLKEQEHRYTSGGSSGGEGALLGSDAAAMGLGTDIGGSLRIPASFCGIYSIKPSPGRTSGLGTTDPGAGFDAIAVCEGPMGRSVEDIRRGCKVILGKLHAKVPIPYRDEKAAEIKGKKLKFGYYLSDGFIKASPACQRAVTESVDALRKAGHECVAFTPPDVLEAMKIFVGLTAADGYGTLLSHLGPDPQEESLFLVTLGPKLPAVLRKSAAWAAEKSFKDEIFAECLRHSRPRSTKQLMQVTVARDRYIQMWETKVWDKMGFDGIICPVIASPGLPHGATKTLSPLACGTILYNIVTSSVGIIPVTRVDPAKDKLSDEWKRGSAVWKNKNNSRNAEPSPTTNATATTSTSADAATEKTEAIAHPSGPHGSRIIEQDMYEGGIGTKRCYDPDAMAGLPVGIQIVGRLFEDEKVIEMMQVVDEALGERGFGPGSSSHYSRSKV